VTIGGRWVVVFAGDKGGSMESHAQYMKWGFYIVKKDKPQDLSNFVTYCFMDCPDTMENMQTCHGRYTQDIWDLQFITCLGREILVKCSGDFNHLGNTCGQQGSGATYSSIYSLITNDHKQNYHKENNVPHNEDNPDCIFATRLTEDFYSNYVENCVNDPVCARQGGKKSESIIGRSLFPMRFEVIDHVMFPCLHVVTGNFCKAETAFFKVVRELDEHSQERIDEINQTRLDVDDLLTKENDLTDKKIKTANEILEVMNVRDALEGETNISDDRCETVPCKVSGKRPMIECDNPEHITARSSQWVHVTCEGVLLYYFFLIRHIYLYLILF
jgi:hypothetical protein